MKRANYSDLVHFPPREQQILSAGVLQVILGGRPHVLGWLPGDPVRELQNVQRDFLDTGGLSTVSRTWRPGPGPEILQDSWTWTAGPENTKNILYRRDRLSVVRRETLTASTLQRESVFSSGYLVPAFSRVIALGFGCAAAWSLTTSQFHLVRVHVEAGGPGRVDEPFLVLPPVRSPFTEIDEDGRRWPAYVGPYGNCYRVDDRGQVLKTHKVTGPRTRVQFIGPASRLELDGDNVTWRGPSGYGTRVFGAHPVATERRLFYVTADGAIESVENEGWFIRRDHRTPWTDVSADQLPGDVTEIAADPELGLLGAWTDASPAPVLLANWFTAAQVPVVWPDTGRVLRGAPSLAEWVQLAVSGALAAREQAEDNRSAARRVSAASRAAAMQAAAQERDQYLRGLLLQE